MSSEMRYTDDDLRVIVQDWSESDPDQAVAINLARECLRHRALLARTEAGADGADLIQWRYTNDETGEVLTPWTECDAAFREKRKDAPGYQFRELFTRPQDASGDAEDARRYRWLRDKSPRTSERGKVGLFIGHGSVYSGFGQPYRSDLDEVVDCAMAGGDTYDLLKKLGEKRAAMQAKEAK